MSSLKDCEHQLVIDAECRSARKKLVVVTSHSVHLAPANYAMLLSLHMMREMKQQLEADGNLVSKATFVISAGMLHQLHSCSAAQLCSEFITAGRKH